MFTYLNRTKNHCNYGAHYHCRCHDHSRRHSFRLRRHGHGRRLRHHGHGRRVQRHGHGQRVRRHGHVWRRDF